MEACFSATLVLSLSLFLGYTLFKFDWIEIIIRFRHPNLE